MDLKTPLKDAGRLYKSYSSRLEKLGITKIEDFLYHIPFRYDDYSIISKIGITQEGEMVTVQGTVTEIRNEHGKRGLKLQKAKLTDNSGTIDVIWFNQPYLTNIIRLNDFISLSGKVAKFANRLVMESPEYELATNFTIHTGRLVPVYSETKGVSSKWLRRQIYKIIQQEKQNILEYIPDSIIEKYNFFCLSDVIEQIHFPKTVEDAQKARERLSFDELFLLQLRAMLRKKEWEDNFLSVPFKIAEHKKNIERFWSKLPFTLTDAQKNAVKDIFKDLASKKPMNRLLEGDVGSGKTVVSAIAMYLAFLNGLQSVLMAPTEILAQQHYKTISNLLEPFRVRVELITGGSKFKVHPTEGGEKFNILVGTHAVLSKRINFDNLGLVVIDEQQRFGVEQRALIRKKGANPHLLSMTATPIPRTVALTLYGDLDLSYLDEMPKGRRKIKTWVVPSEKRERAYEWIRSQLSTGQAFIICPFIEESESMITIKAAKKEHERLTKNVFPNLKLGLLHGKLKSKDKDNILKEFKKGKYDILVSTPVVEVGIDIPNATIIVIEGAERFGLAQLHQLRGRVGRGDKQSYCLLFTDSKSEQTITRLKALETTFSGANLAEVDLKLRGPGEIFGTKQHGIPLLKIASFSDFTLIEKTRKEAQKILPQLANYPRLQEKLKYIHSKEVSPD